MSRPVGVGLIGSQFISSIHAESLRACPQAELFAVASPTAGARPGLRREASRIPHHFTDYRKMLEMPELDMVVIGAPNDLHCQMTRGRRRRRASTSSARSRCA